MFEITISPRLCLLRDQSVFPTASKYSFVAMKVRAILVTRMILRVWKDNWNGVKKRAKKAIKILTGVNHDNENFSRLLGQTVYFLVLVYWYISVSVVSFFPAHSFYSHVVMTSALMENCIMMLFDCHLHSSKFLFFPHTGRHEESSVLHCCILPPTLWWGKFSHILSLLLSRLTDLCCQFWHM